MTTKTRRRQRTGGGSCKRERGEWGLGFQAPWEEGAGLIGEAGAEEGRRMADTAMAGAEAGIGAATPSREQGSEGARARWAGLAQLVRPAGTNGPGGGGFLRLVFLKTFYSEKPSVS